MMEEEKLKPQLSNHIYLILLKFIPHIIAVLYIVATLLQFFGVDSIGIGYIIHILLILWLFIASSVFNFCYVHRLPLYYVMFNEIMTIIDYYIGIPVSIETLLGIHINAILIIILRYSRYYLYDKHTEIGTNKYS